MIYHITNPDAWQASQQTQSHSAPSLADEGFIHLSTIDQVVRVADRIYQGQTNLLLLCVDETKVEAEVKWEPPAHPDKHKPVPTAEAELFPHIYGTINLDAVVKVVEFPCNADGTFSLPDEL